MRIREKGFVSSEQTRLYGTDRKIQYYPDSATFFSSFTYSSAPTRRRRKAGVGRTSPLSGACHLPKPRTFASSISIKDPVSLSLHFYVHSSRLVLSTESHC